MKQFFKIFSFIFLFFFLHLFAFAQEDVKFVVSGTEKGKIDAVKQNGITYVDVQQASRKFNVGVSFFAQSKQIKITSKGFYAILTAPLEEVIVNAQTEKLSAPVIVHKGSIMSPVEFFLLPSFQQAVGKVISFADNSFFVERPFNFERLENKISTDENLIVFKSSKKIEWTEEHPNNHSVTINFKDVKVKRDERFKFKGNLITSIEISQVQTGALVKIQTGKDVKSFSVIDQGETIIIRAAKKAAKPITKEPVVELAEPSVFAEEALPTPKPELTISPIENPSVLPVEEDDFEEMTLTTVSVTEPEKKLTVSPVEPPVIKPISTPTISPVHQKKRIVIDPGHGGKDPGAVRGNYREKIWNLSVALDLAKLLQKAGFDVKITREDDTFVALSKRSKISNDFKADLFVSVHTNSSKTSTAKGFQVYFRSEKATDKEADDVAAFENEAMKYEEVHYNFVDALLQSMATNEYINESSKLAGYIRNSVYKQPGIGIPVSQNSSVRQANFYVLKGVQSPAVLVEMGYISNSSDRARLANKNVRAKMAQGIFDGIYSYAKQEGWLKK